MAWCESRASRSSQPFPKEARRGDKKFSLSYSPALGAQDQGRCENGKTLGNE